MALEVGPASISGIAFSLLFVGMMPISVNGQLARMSAAPMVQRQPC